MLLLLELEISQVDCPTQLICTWNFICCVVFHNKAKTTQQGNLLKFHHLKTILQFSLAEEACEQGEAHGEEVVNDMYEKIKER